jgi:hypothetical protein
MLVHGKPFDSSSTYLSTYRTLRRVAYRIRSIRFPAREIIQLLMLEFFRHHMLFHVWFLCLFYGRHFKIFCFRFDSPIVRLIFQSEPELLTEFTFRDFTFHLVEYNLQEDKFVCVVSRGDFTLLFFFYGIDASQRCGPSSNLDFVHFCW